MREPVAGAPGAVVATASEIIAAGTAKLPGWASAGGTRYLIVLDVPVAAIMRVPAILHLRKPDRRLHVTPDPVSVRRLLVAQARPVPADGIVDAHVLGSDLVILLGDLSVHALASRQISVLQPVEQIADFRIDPDGSFLEWPADDVHVSAAGLMEEVDPRYRARRALESLEEDRMGEVLARIRQQAGLRQADIEGLSTRHVRRIEKGTSSLTLDAAGHVAAALGLGLAEFLDELAEGTSELRRKAALPR